MHAHPPAHAPSTSRTRDGGFTVVELIVAMIIIAILMAAAIITFGGAKSSTRAKEAQAAGASYQQAIAQYQADHANKLPTAAEMQVLQGKPAGPVNLLGKPYMRSVPEGVLAGRVGASMNGSNCGAGLGAPGGASKESGWISYCPGTAPDFSIRVITRKSSGTSWTSDGAAVCWYGVMPSGQKACAK